jgi:Rap1a immunity proteins
MKPTFIAVAILACSIFSSSVRAQTTTGSDIISKCKQAVASADSPSATVNHYEPGFCAGFVAGINETEAMWQASDKDDHRDHLLSFCFPDTSTDGQLLRVFVKYLEDHPEELHESAAFLYLKAMHRAFPCGK